MDVNESSKTSSPVKTNIQSKKEPKSPDDKPKSGKNKKGVKESESEDQISVAGKNKNKAAKKKKKDKEGKQGKTDEVQKEVENTDDAASADIEKPFIPPEYTAEDIKSVFDKSPIGESPVDLSLCYKYLAPCTLPSLRWNNFSTTPIALKITNTSYSVVLTGKWLRPEMPYISGGPLMEEYAFSQIHFHWGGVVKDFDVDHSKLWILCGSEHTVDREQYPFEMHAVFYKRSCENHEAAKRVPYGIMILAYLCADISEEDNPYLLPITEALCRVMKPYDSRPLNVVPLQSILPGFSEDYLLYSGYMKYKCNHGILWIISRQSFFVSLYQLGRFQGVLNTRSKPITNPFREVQPLDNRWIFLVNGYQNLDALIHYRESDLKALEEDKEEPQKKDSTPEKKKNEEKVDVKKKPSVTKKEKPKKKKIME